MAKIEIKYDPNPLGGEPIKYYHNKETGDQYREYRRIVGGIAWPCGGKKGFAVVLAEDKSEDPVLKTRPLRLLDEHPNLSPGDLIRRCSDFQGEYQVEEWLGDDTHRGYMNVLSRQNKVHISPAPFLGDPHALETYLSSIRERTQPNKKSLFLKKDSLLLAALNAFPEDKMTAPASDFPPIAALGYVVSCLDEMPYDNTKDEAARDEYVAKRDRGGI